MGPGGEGLGAAGPEVCGGVVVSAAGEHIGDLIMGGEEALNLPRRLEPGAAAVARKDWDGLTTAGAAEAQRLRQRAQLILDLLTPPRKSPFRREVDWDC